MYKYDKDSLKENLTLDQVYELIVDLGGQPQMNHNFFISKTICHNYIGEGSYKLYYYDNTKLFRCFTHCDEAFDLFQLVLKIKKLYYPVDRRNISSKKIPLFYGGKLIVDYKEVKTLDDRILEEEVYEIEI